MSHQKLVGVCASPVATIRSTNASHSPYERVAGGAPCRGRKPSTSVRIERIPVSCPSKYGEFAESASTSGSHGKTVSSTRWQVSASGMPTCTCSPLTPCRRADGPA